MCIEICVHHGGGVVRYSAVCTAKEIKCWRILKRIVKNPKKNCRIILGAPNLNGIYVVDNYLEIFKGFLTKYTRMNLNGREESNPP